jgi:2-oxoglutarate ferredoxin oxidoreductase subunit alpha
MIRNLAGNVKGMIMPEINMGQMVLELERCAGGKCPVKLVTHPGGAIIKPSAILKAIEDMLGVKK